MNIVSHFLQYEENINNFNNYLVNNKKCDFSYKPYLFESDDHIKENVIEELVSKIKEKNVWKYLSFEAIKEINSEIERYNKLHSKSISLLLHEQSRVTNVSNKILKSLQADSFIQENIDIDLKNEFLPYLQTEPLDSIQKSGINELLQNIKTLSKCKYSDIQSLCAEVKTLEKGKKILIEGGWNHEEDTHKLLYLVEKNKDDTFSFTIINTGAGLKEFHQEEKQTPTKSKYSPIVRISEIKLEQMANPEFFYALSDLLDKKTKMFFNENDLYSRILPALLGKRDFEFETNFGIIKEKRSDIHLWKPLIKLLLYESGDSGEYKKSVFNLRRKSLEDSYKSILQNNLVGNSKQILSDEDMTLLKNAAENFTRLTLKYYKKNLINKEELDEVSKLTDEIFQRVKLEEKPKSTATMVLKGKCQPFTEGVVLKNIFKAPEALPSISSPIDKYPTGVKTPSFNGPPKTLSEFNNKLQDLTAICRNLNEARYYKDSIAIVIRTIGSLETLGFKKDEWQDRMTCNATQAEIENTMALIQDLNTLFFKSIIHLPESERDSLDHFILMIILMAMNEKLSQQLDADHNPLKGSPGDHYGLDHDQFLRGLVDNPFAIISNPSMRNLFNETRAYLNKTHIFARKFSSTSFLSNEQGQIHLEFDQTGKIKESHEFKQETLSEAVFYNHGGLKLLLRNENFLANIYKKYPDLKDKTDAEIIKKILPLFPESDLFPKSYTIILEQNMIFDYFVRNPHLKKININQDSKLNFKLDIREACAFKIDFFGTSDYAVDSEILNDTREGRMDFVRSKFEASLPIEHPGLKEILKPKVGAPPTRLNTFNFDSQCNEAVVEGEKPKLSRYETQALYYIRSNKPTMISSLISYFNENPGKLEDRDYQFFFYSCLFCEGILERFVDRTFGLKVITDFLIKQFKLQQVFNNKQGQIFYLWIMDELITHIQEAEGNIKINIKEELYRLAASIDDKSNEDKKLKALVYQQWIASFHTETKLSDSDCFNLAKAYSYLEAEGVDPRFTHISIENKVDTTMSLVVQGLNQLSEETHSKLASEILKEVCQIEVKQWKGGYPLLEAESGFYKIDLKAFKIFKENVAIGGLPAQILKDTHFRELFKNENFTVTSSKPGIYEFNCMVPTVPHRVFFSKTDHSLVIQKKIGEDWFTFIPGERLGMLFAAQEGLREYFHWAGNPREELAMIIENKKDKSLHSTIIFKPKSAAIAQVQEWKRSQSEDKTDAPILQKITNKTLLEFLSVFQPPETIFRWGNRILEFASLKLEFHDNAEGLLVMSTKPEFHLAKIQSPPKNFSQLSGYLKIENKIDETKYLFPKGPISIESARGAFKREVKPDLSKNQNEYFIFTEKNGQLIGENPEQHLYLAYLNLAHKNYEAAASLLKQYLVGKPLGFSDSERAVYSWMMNLIKEGKDSSPQAFSIALQATYLQMRNLPIDAPLNEKVKIAEELKDLLVKYYPLRRHTKTSGMLSQVQELEIIQYCRSLKIGPEILVKREEELKNLGLSQASTPIKKGNKFEITIPSQLNLIEPSDFNKLLGKVQEPKTISYANGELKILKQFPQLVGQVLSNDATVRRLAISKLALMRIEKSSPYFPIKEMLFWMSSQVSDKERRLIQDELIKMPRFTSKQSQTQIDKSKIFTIYSVLYSVCSNFVTKFTEIKDLPLDHETPVSDETTIPIQLKKTEKSRTTSPQLKAGINSFIYYPGGYVIQFLKLNRIDLTEKDSTVNHDKLSCLRNELKSPEDASVIVRNEILRVNESIEAYESETTATKSYEFDDNKLTKMSACFDNKIKTLGYTAAKQKDEILLLANQLPSDLTEAIIQKMKISGKMKKYISLDDLIIFYLQNNGEALLKCNPYLSQNAVYKICDLLNDYMVNSTESAYLSRLKELADGSIKASGDLKVKKMADLDSALREERNYNPEENPTMLIYEYYSGFRLRAKQVKTITEMTIKPGTETKNLVNQLIMGSGKSKVILPLLAYLNSHGKNVPFIVVPDMLYETNLEDMRIFSGELYKQEVETIHFKEGESLTVSKCDEILETLQRVKNNRSYCLLNATTVHSLHLHFKEIVKELADNIPNITNEQQERYEKIKQIIHIFRNEGDAIIDEADMVLDCLKEVNFSSGIRNPLSDETQRDLREIFIHLLRDPKLNKFLKLEKETETPFDVKKYNEEIKPLLAEMLLDLAKCQTLKTEEQKVILNYLLRDPSIKAIPDTFKNADIETQRLLSLGKELIHTLFPLALQKNCDEHFGLSKIYALNMAIPYTRTNNPSEGSEFSSPYETMIYTMLHYSRKGVSDEQIKLMIKELKESALSEFSAGIPLEQTTGYLKFEALNLFPGKNLCTVQDSDISKAVLEFNKNVENRLNFACDVAWKEIGIYFERLSSNSQDLVGMFHSTQGFTGTLWNQNTYHSSLKPEPEKSIDGKSLSIIYQSESKVLKPFSSLNDFYSSLANYDACIDTGSWFRGISAISAAQQILSHLPLDKEGVIYFNDVDIPAGTKGQAVILKRDMQKTPLLLANTSYLEPQNFKKRFTYYNITTGADVPQDDLAKALISFSKTTTLRDFLQGVWRMRGLGSKQVVDVAIPEELGLKQDLAEIFLLSILNQGNRQEKDNPHALKQKISQAVEHIIEEVLLLPQLDAKAAGEIGKDVKNFLIKRSIENPLLLFSNVLVEAEMKTIIDAYITKICADIKPMYDKYDYFKNVMPFEELKTKIESLVNYDQLSKTDYWTAASEDTNKQTDYNLTMQVKKEVKQEQKNEMRTQLQVENVEENLSQLHGGNAIGWKYEGRNLFSESLWHDKKEGPAIKEVDQFLKENAPSLIECDLSQSIFSSHLKLSKNFQFFNNNPKDMIPFQSGTKPIGVCALMINKKNPEELTLCMLHPQEAEFLGRMIGEEKKYLKNVSCNDSLVGGHPEILFGKESRDFDLILVNPGSGIEKVAEPSESPPAPNLAQEKVAEKIQNNPEFVKLMSQAKFFNGNITNYTSEELVYLKKWISEVGAAKMENLLLRNILKSRPKDRNRYNGSPLQKMFDSLMSV